MKEIKYIGFYDVPNAINKRACALAATNKMDYICEAINRAGYKVKIVSPSWFTNVSSNTNYIGTTELQVSVNKKLILTPSFRAPKKIIGYFKIIFSLLWFFSWLVRNVKRGEKILVYHSPWLVVPILIAKKIKKFHLILEVEEVYSDVSSLDYYFDKLEQKIFKKANSFIFSTELLVERLKTTKPYLVIYGNYKVYDRLSSLPNDGKIHLVYAGIIDSDKAGAFNAIESALYLPKNYIMHIIGFGDVAKLQLRIAEINKIAKCKVVYDGLKKGEDFIKYCQMCHIGLSTQKMEGAYLESSFPSKILTYLGLGLSVVSCYISCVEKSKIGKEIFYYKEDDPHLIAAAIESVNINNLKDCSSIIRGLELKFIEEIKELFV